MSIAPIDIALLIEQYPCWRPISIVMALTSVRLTSPQGFGTEILCSKRQITFKHQVSLLITFDVSFATIIRLCLSFIDWR
jgi:hypothetical protein